jgi:hypothetical protein
MRTIQSPRGDLTVDLGGETVRLRLDFTALAAIEATLQKGFFTLAQSFATADVRVHEMAVLLKEALHAASGVESSLESVGERLLHDGVQEHLETCLHLLAQALKGTLPPKEAKTPPVMGT